MEKQSLAIAASVLLVVAAVAPRAGAAQVELDRIVSRAGGRIITQSDVRRARALRLVDDVSSDQAVQRGLETRLLILGEMARAAPLPPIGAADLAARRAEWASSIGGEGQVPALLAPHGMREAELETWLRDDLRIGAYLERRFGMLPDAERSRAIDQWITRLRQRADLE